MSDKLFFSVEEVAVQLLCEPNTVRENARNGVLPGLKFGVDWVFPARALVDSINDQALRAQATRSGCGSPPTPVWELPAGSPPIPPCGRTRPRPNLDAFTPVGGNA